MTIWCCLLAMPHGLMELLNSNWPTSLRVCTLLIVFYLMARLLLGPGSLGDGKLATLFLRRARRWRNFFVRTPHATSFGLLDGLGLAPAYFIVLFFWTWSVNFLSCLVNKTGEWGNGSRP